MSIRLKQTTRIEVEELNKIHEAARVFFLSLDQSDEILDLETCFIKGDLPPGGIRENYHMRSIYLREDIIGYCTYYMGYPDNKTVYISMLYIDDRCRQQGYARTVVTDLCKQFQIEGWKMVRLAVSLKNTNGVRFWFDNGFQRITKVIKATNNLELERCLLS